MLNRAHGPNPTSCVSPYFVRAYIGGDGHFNEYDVPADYRRMYGDAPGAMRYAEECFVRTIRVEVCDGTGAIQRVY